MTAVGQKRSCRLQSELLAEAVPELRRLGWSMFYYAPDIGVQGSIEAAVIAAM
ncbi:hypothetical protein [Mycobacterium sp. 1465703.0]|uniref:hypothetical protein n=1 Tax=Mycobacterium sp. 1465703.0 TaxID=1834078 RepID=UPI0012E99972|nr:hypothetical protein [Mycobacterium sp. 1465703.0]